VKVAIATVQVPFISGGAEVLATSLQHELRRRGHEAEIVSIPFKWYPPERLLDCMLMARLMDLSEINGMPIERVIALKYPAYYNDHPNKVCWLLHQHRQAYDLYGTPFGDLHQSDSGRSVADEIRRWDNSLLPRARAIYTISRTVTQRLEQFNSIASETVYPPPINHERFRCDGYGDFVLYPGRFDQIKRQHLLVEALAMTATPVKAVFIGNMSGSYGEGVLAAIRAHRLEGRVECLGVVDEATKLDLYARCLAVYNGVYDEDYGYLTIEGFLASKPVVTHVDSGGPLEFVETEVNGIVTPSQPGPLAQALDRLFEERDLAQRMGGLGAATVAAKQVNWDHAIARLLQ
jgi:glycosyltransferase involved in cell wall biosynthesis